MSIPRNLSIIADTLNSDGTFASISNTGSTTLSSGTANGVTYLNGSKVLTTGSALSFDGITFYGTNGKFGNGVAANTSKLMVNTASGTAAGIQLFQDGIESWIMGMPASSSGLAWSNSGVEQMRLISTGLGIGTSSPNRKLVVSNAGAQGFEFGAGVGAGSGNELLNYNRSTSLYIQKTEYASSYTFVTGTSGNVTAATIDASGNVGIGITAPAYKLVVSAAGASGIEFAPAFSGTANLIQSYSRSGGVYVDTVYEAAQHRFNISGSEKARIDSSGNVGIGTSSPVYQTQIYGSGQTTAALTDAGNKGGSLLLNTATVAAGDGGALLIGAGGSGAKPYAAIKGLLADGAGNTTGNLAFSTRNATADTALTERMRIDASGNVGIGTSSPSASAILDAQSTTKGVRMPNMTTTQKNAISSPAAGLMVFDTTLAKLCVYSGSAWQTVTSI